MIPEAKKAAVVRALQEAFGVTEFEHIEMLTAGLSSARVFRIVVQGYPYLLRIITRTDAMSDPTRQFACMKSGAEVGLAPRIWYTSVEDRISITDFVKARCLPTTEALVRLPVALRSLHALPAFPKAVNYLEAMDGFIRKFQNAKIVPERETEEVIQSYERVCRVYPRNESDMVSSHNDLKPENVLFDGNRVWLVDWEAAFLNDRYLDLAVLANFVVTNETEEKDYLREYFGEAASEYRLARFYLMRQILHVSYAAVFFLFGSSGKAVEPTAKVPAFRDFHNRVWAGEVSLAGAEAKVQYARVHLNQASRDMRSARFQDALRIVGDNQVGA
jgi:aminoglycoside phosphotransferase (APT) family kinase protein